MIEGQTADVTADTLPSTSSSTRVHCTLLLTGTSITSLCTLR